MMSKNLKSLRSVSANARRYLAAHASPKSAHQAQSSAKPGEVQVTNLPSGLTLASVQSDSALARLAVVIRAGARYEPTDQLGITHTLRAAAGLTTTNWSLFANQMGIDYYGSRLEVSATRDTITYLLEVQKTEDNLLKNFSMLSEIITSPQFYQWELDDNNDRLAAELTVLEGSPSVQLAEALHEAAFKGGLRNSLFISPNLLGKYNTEQLQNFVKSRFTAPNVAVVGLGLEHSDVLDLVGSRLPLQPHRPPKDASKFIGGEIRRDLNSPLTFIALAAEGAGLKSIKDTVALALFQQILGPGQVSQIKNSPLLSPNARLGRAVSAALSGKSAQDVAVSAFSLNYEETGLFGINLIAPATSDLTGLVKSAVKELRAAAASVSDSELNDAKKNLKTQVLLSKELGDSTAIDIGQQLLLAGSAPNLIKEIDSITSADVKTIAGRLLKSKLALASIGRNAPYLDDILPEASN